MLYKNISPKNKDDSVNIIIEIPADSTVKYEFDETIGAIVVDRFSMTTMSYPCNYGLIPNTLGGDEDPIDVLIVTRVPLAPGVVIKGRVIGVLKMTDEAGEDSKIICVPVTKADKLYENVNSFEDLPEIDRKKIKHFFERYKDLEEGKWVKVEGWGNSSEAMELVDESISRFENETN
jgi:inorganic pyrophosphatase